MPLSISGPKPSLPVSLTPRIPHDIHIPAFMLVLVIPAEAEGPQLCKPRQCEL